MKHSHALSIVLVAIASFPSIAAAGEIFDSPGPGYRQQVERLSPPLYGSSIVRIRIKSPSLLSPSLLNPVSDFSQPIRLFIGPLSPASPGAQTQATPKIAQ